MTDVPRCVNPDCPDPYGGRKFPACVKPGRITGRRFGIDGVLCVTCYGRYARGSDLRPNHARKVDAPQGAKPAPNAEAVRTIAQLRAAAEQRRASAEPRRPCTSATGAHLLVQPSGADAYAPFVCETCGYAWTPKQPEPGRRIA